MSADFIAPSLRYAWRRTSNADRADQLIVDDNRKPTRIREESKLDLLQFGIWILDHTVHPSLARLAAHQSGPRLHFRGNDVQIALTVHAVHVDVIAVVIEDVNADCKAFLARQALTCLGNALGSCQIDRGEIVNLLRSFTIDHKL